MVLKLLLESRTRRVTLAVLVALLITACYLQIREGQSGSRPASSASASSVETVSAITARSSTRAAQTVFGAINTARRKAGLPALHWLTGLHRSALTHDFGMAQRNLLSHQLPSEASFGNRITAQRVPWSMAGENIGWTSVMSAPGAVGINAAMLAEKAPHNGHRLNILSRSYNAVGIDVVMDLTHHRLWLTMDFARI